MTDDNFGTETHDQDAVHEEALSSEHEGVSEPPSDYEFADETGATADVEHSEEQMPAEEQPARRSPLVPIAAAVGGVLVLGAVGWWQFSGQPATSNAPLSPMTSASLNITPSAKTAHNTQSVAPVAPAAPPLPVAPKMDMAPPEPAPADTAAALPTDSAKSAAASAPVSTMMPAIAPVSAPTTAAPVVPSMPVSLPSAAATPSIAPLSATAPNAVPPFATATSQSDNQRIDALNARIDTLQKALDQANQQLGQVTNMVAASASPSSAPSSKEMQDKIDRLEQQVASLSRAAPALSVPATSTDEGISEPKPMAPAHTHAHAHKAVHKTPAHKPVVKKVAAPAAPQWVLRAATPGQAWVASDETSHDLKPVKVGDELAGIGRVTAIQQQDGNWIVQGSKGKIQ